jgi:hypothetical protein
VDEPHIKVGFARGKYEKESEMVVIYLKKKRHL